MVLEFHSSSCIIVDTKHSVCMVILNPGQKRTGKSDQPERDEAQIEALSGDAVGGDRNIDSSNHKLQIGFILTSGAHRMNESEVVGDPVAHQIFQGRKCSEKVESTSENDLQKVKSENVCDTADEIVALELSPNVKGNSWQNEEIAIANKTVRDQHSPTNTRVDMKRRKGKEKALSDGDLNSMLPKDEDGSHESVESCNTAGLFSKGKRKRSFEEDLIVGSNGFKKQIHCTQGPTSFRRQDSSFMNWISNMMKGFSKSVQDDTSFPHITHYDDGHENPDKKIITLNKNQDPGSKFIGFQSIFRSLYCAKAEGQETRMLNVEYQVGEGYKEIESSNKMHDINATPIAFHGENSNLGRPFLLLNERFNESTSGNGEDSANQPKMLLEKFSGSHEKGNTNSEENNNEGHLAFSKEKDRTSSNSSFSKRKANSSEKADSVDPTYAVKTTSKFCHRNDPLGSFWVTRFAPKTDGSSSNMDHLNQSAGVSPRCSTECLKLVPHSQNNFGFHINTKILEAKDQSSEDQPVVSSKELENSATKIKLCNDQTPMYNVNPIMPPHELKPLDEMASLFARIKHITSSRGTSSSAHATMTCFFCGIKGHHLQDCSEITEIELEELQRNINTYSGIGELSCLCIKCFQRDHWAVACPKVSSTKRLPMESSSSFSEMHLDSGNEENLKFQTGKDPQFQAAVADTYCEGKELRTDAGLNWKVDGLTDFKKKRSCTSPVKEHIASSSGENLLKENQIIPFSYSVVEKNSDVPRGLFDAVRRLRLSRTDLLK